MIGKNISLQPSRKKIHRSKEEIKKNQEKVYLVYRWAILYKMMSILSEDCIFLLKHQNIHL